MITISKETNKWGVLEIILCQKGYDLYQNHTWTIYKNRHNFYLRRQIYYKDGSKKIESFHRELLGLNIKNLYVDHINRNTLDNRIENLRICSNQENSFNRRKHIDGKSKYKGVSFHKKTQKWQVSITKNNKSYYIGLFKSQEEAAKAYNIKALELFGDFANLNTI